MAVTCVTMIQLVVVMSYCFITIMGRDDKNECTIYQGGCAFHVVLAGSECMSGDAPAQSYGYAAYKSDPASIQYGYQLSSSGPSKMDNEILKENVVETSKVIIKEELEDSAKRFEDLEKKLTHLMEGLSIRSLRHFRKIKSDISQLKSTVDEIKDETKKGGTKKGSGERGERSVKTCPTEFISAGTWNSCYRFSNFAANWREAREYCSAAGSNLVALETIKEAYILDYLMKSHPDYEKPATWWTAGNYIVRSQRWMWATRHHLRPINEDRWAPGEPNSRSTNHCMIISRDDNYNWHDDMCTDKHNFICEYSMK